MTQRNSQTGPGPRPRWKDTLAVWTVGTLAVVAIAIGGSVIRLVDAVTARFTRDDRMPEPRKRPVSSVRKALDRYGR